MRVVRRYEPLNLLGGDGGICKVSPFQALAAQDRKPDLDKNLTRRRAPVGSGTGTYVAGRCPTSSPLRWTSGNSRGPESDDEEVRRRLLVEQGQRLAELPRAMFETDHAKCLAIVDAEASQQVDGTIAH